VKALLLLDTQNVLQNLQAGVMKLTLSTFTFKDCKIVRFKEFFDTYIAGEAFRKK
jgi:hypothetical protein